jgi:alpha-aminoadipic semialdehyde synthase
MMTVDNLPTQLPKDASEYFGSSLTPLLVDYIDKSFDGSAVFKNAAITVEGKIVDEFRSQLEPLIEKYSMKKVLILGAGLVSRPVIEYLSQFPDFDIDVVSPTFSAIPKDVMDKFVATKRVHFYQHEIYENKLGKVGKMIEECNVVVSLLPAIMHPWILETVFNFKKHLITASYISPNMSQYQDRVKEEGLVWLNEVGLDPGLDHMSAMRLIDGVKERQQGNVKIESFVSWCGGLPAPEHADNPIGYKFSWSPAGALRALSNPARFLEDGKVVEIAGEDLLSSARPVNLHPAFRFEGYANRDSLKYIDMYKLDRQDLKTMFRGTLRYGGFPDFMLAMQRLGFLDETRPCPKYASWREAILDALKVTIDDGSIDLVTLLSSRLNWPTGRSVRVVQAMNHLGFLTRDAKNFELSRTPLEALCRHLQPQLSYRPGERDMAFLHHELLVTSAQDPGRKERLTSTLVIFGNHSDTAMSLTVGLPVAVATKLLLHGQFSTCSGVIAPTLKSVYEPMLRELDGLGIRFAEHSVSL